MMHYLGSRIEGKQVPSERNQSLEIEFGMQFPVHSLLRTIHIPHDICTKLPIMITILSTAPCDVPTDISTKHCVRAPP